MKRILVLSLTFLLTNLGRGQASAELKFAAIVSQPSLQKTVHDLVKVAPRMGGTRQGDESANILLKMFKAYGLKAEILDDPELLAFSNERWSLTVEEPSSLRTLIKYEWLAGFSPSVKQRRGRVVYIDRGKLPGTKEFDGSILLTDRFVDSGLYQEFLKAGAICILSYAPGVEGKYSDWAQITNLRSSMENPIPLFNLSYSNGSRLKTELLNGAEISVSFSTQTSIAKGRPKTVVATLQGQSDEYYLVCAHGDSDSGGPGADDNASGVAGVMEVARTLQDLVQTKTIPQPRKSIKFIVWGSEYFSTQDYVRHNAGALQNILGVMNYDEIGTGAERNCLYLESNDVPHNESFMRTLNGVLEDYVGKEGFWEEATTTPSQGGTDSYVFLPEYLKRLQVPYVRIPSVTIYTAAWDVKSTLVQTPGWNSKAWNGSRDSVTIDYSRYYHSSLDIPELTTDTEPFNMVWAVKAVGIALLRLAW